jgi:nitrate reductase gamma subunit
VVTWNINAWTTVVDVHWLYKLHIFLGLIITMLFPFTRLVHIWSGFAAPFRYLLMRPGYQIVRSRRRRSLEERRSAHDALQGPAGPVATTPAE